MAVNQLVAGSNPARPTNFPYKTICYGSTEQVVAG